MSAISCLLLVLLWSQLGRFGSGGVQIIIDPPKSIAHTVEAVHISCLPDSLDGDIQEVTLIELARKDHKPLVYFSKCGNGNFGEDSSGFQAVANIATDPSQSYLNVTLMNPESDDTGIYTCSLYYTDKSGHMKMETASGNLLIENIDVTSLEKVLNQMGDKITSLGKENKKFIERTASLEKENKKSMERITSLEKENKKSIERIGDENKKSIERIGDENKKSMERIGEENKKSMERITSLEKENQILKEKARTKPNMFKVRVKPSQELVVGTKVKLDECGYVLYDDDGWVSGQSCSLVPQRDCTMALAWRLFQSWTGELDLFLESDTFIGTDYLGKSTYSGDTIQGVELYEMKKGTKYWLEVERRKGQAGVGWCDFMAWVVG